MADFLTAYRHTKKVEGGYVNDPADAGGETYKGIARNYHPDWKGWPIIDGLKQAPDFRAELKIMEATLQPFVESFYKSEFWDKVKGDDITDQAIAAELFDTGVNFGISRAVKMAQEAVKLSTDLNIDVDGKIGPATVGAINSHKNKPWLFQLMNCLQAEAYIEICRSKPSQEKFLRGWIQQRVHINQ